MKKDRVHARKLRLAYYRRTRQIIHSIKESTPCADCGKKYPHYVMEFDHKGSGLKVANVAGLSSCSRVKIIREISKCDLVCSNCHCIRTHKRRRGKYAVSCTPFKDWNRPHVASLVPRKDGKILVICSQCRKRFWYHSVGVRWEMSKPQAFICSVKCGFAGNNKNWRSRHKAEIRAYLRTLSPRKREEIEKRFWGTRQ